MEETEIEGFLSDQQTFYCANVDHGQVNSSNGFNLSKLINF